MSILQAENLSYTYVSKYQRVDALREVSCSFSEGNMYAITGESGSGKTTFLSLLAGLDDPTGGQVIFDGTPLREIDKNTYRKKSVSIIFQSFNLFPLLTSLDNVIYSLRLNGASGDAAKKEAKKALEKVGLPARVHKQYPRMLSGGEQQRVAVARAIATKNRVILADEPTGNLDSKNTENIIQLLLTIAHEEQYAVVIVTHDKEVADRSDHVYTMKDGKLV